jgi:hypothetical protein
MQKKLKILTSCLLFAVIFLTANNSLAAPSVTSVSGTIKHGQSFTINGSGFGTKSTAAPKVWDDCSGTKVSDRWSGAWPDAGSAANQLTYRAPLRSVALPHSHISKYLAGAHADGAGYNAGYNVMVWKTLTGVTYPKYIYLSAYVRHDPSWYFGSDNNMKTFDFSNGDSPYTMNSGSDSNWYGEYNGQFSSANNPGAWHMNDDGASLMIPDANGRSVWWDAAANVFTGWVKQEFELLITNQSNGYFKVWENGVLKVNYLGSTDKYSGSTKSIALGGYTRQSNNANNWRYFADIYFDESSSRVLICNGSTYANRGLCEVQIPAAWSDSGISVNLNQGAFADSSIKYLYVVDSAGAVNSGGYSVTFGSGGGTDTTAPAAPRNVVMN